MAFDPKKDPELFVIQKHPRSTSVLGPANTNEGACWGRREICQCLSFGHEDIAIAIAQLLNAADRRLLPDMESR